MLDFDEHSGVFTFLGGMVVIVMVAVGFSLVMDKRFKSTSGIGEIRREVRQQEEEIKELTMRHEHQEMLLVRTVSALKSTKTERADLERKQASLKLQGETLGEKKAVLQAAVAKLENDFSEYRAKYRNQTWSRAVGEKLGDITIRGGRHYKDSQITKVTDVGLEIRHEHGYARLQGPDLSMALQERFQWNDEERRRRLKEEDERLHGKPKAAVAQEDAPNEPVAVRQEPVLDDWAKKKAERQEKQEIIQSHRAKVMAWKRKVSRLNSERSTAISNSYGSNKTVPGTLETWKTRSEKLSKELERARNELDIAKSKLAVLSPGDPELAQDR